MPNSQHVIDTWQHRLDREFPNGAVCSWDRPGDPRAPIYRVPRIEVVDAAGLDPVVKLVPIERDWVLGPEQVTSYSPAPGDRWPPGTVRVTLGGLPGTMYWNPKVPAVMANRAPEAEPEAGPQ